MRQICSNRITVKFGCEASELMTAVPTAMIGQIQDRNG
jgi:hypothetical protein